MFSSTHDKLNQNNDTARSPVVVGDVSAAACIALGTAAAMYLSKEDNRKKLMDSLEEVRVKAKDAFKTFVTKTEKSEAVKNNAKNLRNTLSL